MEQSKYIVGLYDHEDTLLEAIRKILVIPAAERGHVEMVKLLVHTAVDINHVNHLGWTALLEAIVLSVGGPRHQQIVQILVDAGADVNIGDKEGITPLQHARQKEFHEIVRILETAGAT